MKAYLRINMMTKKTKLIRGARLKCAVLMSPTREVRAFSGEHQFVLYGELAKGFFTQVQTKVYVFVTLYTFNLVSFGFTLQSCKRTEELYMT